jgi:hypothetical protein
MFSSIRVWLAGAFLLVSVVTALAIALYVLPKAEREFAQLSERAGAVDAERAAVAVSSASTPKKVQDEVKALSGLSHMSLWIYDARRELRRSSGTPFPGSTSRWARRRRNLRSMRRWPGGATTHARARRTGA